MTHVFHYYYTTFNSITMNVFDGISRMNSRKYLNSIHTVTVTYYLYQKVVLLQRNT